MTLDTNAARLQDQQDEALLTLTREQQVKQAGADILRIFEPVTNSHDSNDKINTLKNVYYHLRDHMNRLDLHEILIVNTMDNNNTPTQHPMPSRDWGDACCHIINGHGKGLITARLIEGNGPQESAYRVEITFHWKEPEKIQQAKKADTPPPRLSRASVAEAQPETDAEHRKKEERQLLKKLEDADTSPKILGVLRILQGKGYTVSIVHHGQTVNIAPTNIIELIKQANDDVSKGIGAVRRSVRSICAEYNIRKHLEHELLPEAAFKMLDKDTASRAEIEEALHVLKELNKTLEGLHGERERVTRDPAQILEAISAVAQASSRDSVKLIAQVTSMYDIDAKVYLDIREDWNPLERIITPIPTFRGLAERCKKYAALRKA